jgi:ABC-type Fe3+-hydroxamate transport system substrate-binding protein
VLAGCRPAASSGSSVVVDDLGNRVHVTPNPRRIVSLAPATTELLFAMGWGDRVVGRTRYDVFPREVAQVPSVGEGLNPNVEAVAARTPDLVVMYATPGNAPVVEQLARLGIPAVNVKMDRLAELPHSARLLASLIGDSLRVDSIVSGFERQLDSLERASHPALRRIAWIVWDNPPMVIGTGSFLNDLVRLAGGKNVFDDLPQPSPTVSIETIAARDPDIFLLLSSDSLPPAYALRPEWQTVRAVRTGRFGLLRGSQFSWPSLRAPQAVRDLQRMFAAIPPLPKRASPRPERLSEE